MNLLVTGGCGFIGSNFIRYWLENNPQDKIVNLDKLTYAGNLANLKDVSKSHPSNYSFVRGDICDRELVKDLLKREKVETLVNFAAESHNSHAVLNPCEFFTTNVIGTQSLLEAARIIGIKRFHQISTCEVFGQLSLDSSESFKEDSPYRPRTPYNASKAGADLAAKAYFETFGLPVTISICCNNYGPFQFPEKVIPLFTTNALDELSLPVYTHSQNRREWIHVLDHCEALSQVLKNGKVGETYNIGTGLELSVDQITQRVLDLTKKPSSLIRVVQDRPGHDTRYLLDSSKIGRELGWSPKIDFRKGLSDTINWYINNREWWEPLKEGLVKEGNWR
jgi:dTDP-glucose 4,6-dehydratase